MGLFQITTSTWHLAARAPDTHKNIPYAHTHCTTLHYIESYAQHARYTKNIPFLTFLGFPSLSPFAFPVSAFSSCMKSLTPFLCGISCSGELCTIFEIEIDSK